MPYVLGSLVAVFVVVMAVAALTGRFRPRTCCPADPTRDLRMRAALGDRPPTSPSARADYPDGRPGVAPDPPDPREPA
ncbi:MAG: hypothetical protein M0Z30_05445 [Actinomycetota bacterium]|nr:hypothetical protein [Actinomycetota bacterium]